MQHVTHRSTDKERSLVRLGVRGLLLLLTFVLMLAVAPAASASTASRSAETGVKYMSAGPESCAAAIVPLIGKKDPKSLIVAAVSAPYCGAWLGGLNADFICWQTRQWWGWEARAKVWLITGTHYTRC